MARLTPEQRERLVQALIYHQRVNATYCACGWGELGKSHAEHVVRVFEMEEELRG